MTWHAMKIILYMFTLKNHSIMVIKYHVHDITIYGLRGNTLGVKQPFKSIGSKPNQRCIITYFNHSKIECIEHVPKWWLKIEQLQSSSQRA